MRRWTVKLVTRFLVVQLLLLSLPDQINAVKNRLRKQRSKPEQADQQARQPGTDYDYDYYYDYEEKNGEFEWINTITKESLNFQFLDFSFFLLSFNKPLIMLYVQSTDTHTHKSDD